MKFPALPVWVIVALAAGCANAPASDPGPIPADILARQTCREDIVHESQVAIADDLAAAFQEFGGQSASVIVSYDLDGSGKAVEPLVIYANPRKLFDKIALRQLADTRFAPGVIRKSCAFVSTYTIRSTGTVELPIGLEPKVAGKHHQ